MTVVIAIQHPSWVLIGADRLLSKGRSNGERKAVKALFYLSDLVWGYSGIARVYDKSNRLVSTDRWLAQTLANIGHRPADEVITSVCEQATETFKRSAKFDRAFPGYALSFLTAGWIRKVRGTAPRPIIAQVTNIRPSDGEELRTLPEFCVYSNGQPLTAAGNSMVRAAAIGQHMNSAERTRFADQLTKAVIDKRESRVVAKVVSDSIRSVSDRLAGRFVGRSTQILTLGHEEPPDDHVAIEFPQCNSGICATNREDLDPRKDRKVTGNFFHFHDGRQHGWYEGPHLVCPGFPNMGFYGIGRKKGWGGAFKLEFGEDANGQLAILFGPKLGVLFGIGGTAKTKERSRRPDRWPFPQQRD